MTDEAQAAAGDLPEWASPKSRRPSRSVQLPLWPGEYDQELLRRSAWVRHRHTIRNVRDICEAYRPIAEAERAELERKDYALYRHYDCHGRLLYVGMTNNPDVRIKAHKRQSRWFADIVSVKVEWITGFSKVCEAEVNAIRNEAPLYNVVHNDIPQPALSFEVVAKPKGRKP